jgi:hypothetical protein
MKILARWKLVLLAIAAACPRVVAQESLSTCGVDLKLGLPESQVMERVSKSCRLVSMGERSFGVEEEKVFPSGNRLWGLVGIVEFRRGKLVRATRSLTGPTAPSGPEITEFTSLIVAGLARLVNSGGPACVLSFERMGPETGQPVAEYSGVVVKCGRVGRMVSIGVDQGKAGDATSGTAHIFEEIRSN